MWEGVILVSEGEGVCEGVMGGLGWHLKQTFGYK